MSTISIVSDGLLRNHFHQVIPSDVLLVAPLPRKVARHKSGEYINSSVQISPPKVPSPSQHKQVAKARGFRVQDAEIRIDDISSYGFTIVKAVRIERRRSSFTGKMLRSNGTFLGAGHPSIHDDEIADNGEACAELLEIMNGTSDTKETPFKTNRRQDASVVIRHEIYPLSKNSCLTGNETKSDYKSEVLRTEEFDSSTNGDPNDDESTENLLDEEVSSEERPVFQQGLMDITGHRLPFEEDITSGFIKATEYGLGQSPISRAGNPVPFNSPFGHWNIGSAKCKRRQSPRLQTLPNQNLRSISFNNSVRRSQTKSRFNIRSTRQLSSPSLSEIPVQSHPVQESTLLYDHDKCGHPFNEVFSPSVSPLSGSIPYRIIQKPVIIAEDDSNSDEEETDLHEEEIQNIFARLRARSLSVGDRPLASPPGY